MVDEQAVPEVWILVGEPFVVAGFDSGSNLEWNEPALNPGEGRIVCGAACPSVIVKSVPTDVLDPEVVRGRQVVDLDLDGRVSEIDVLRISPVGIGRKLEPGCVVVALPVQRCVLADVA